MKILCKFPSRGRPERFKSTLLKHIEHQSKNNEFKFVFTFDEDDVTMNNDDIKNFIKNLNINYEIFYGNSKSKIEAINANMENQDFDILILIADDMIPGLQNYDEVICEIFNSSENKLDSTIHFNTSRWSDILDIWCIMGRDYYKRFNYIYHPEYKSICSDNEYTEVAKLLNRRIFSNKSPFYHQNIIGDDTEVKNFYFNIEDNNTYYRRKENNFDLNLD